MKTVVAVQDLLELEIKPDELLAEFARLTERDVPARLVPRATEDAACPGCGRREGAPAFEKLGLAYLECGHCGSVYVSPRPDQAVIDDYYRSGDASRFWRERVVPATETARAEKVAGPRAQWVADGLAEHRPDARSGIDLSPLSGPFGTALRQLAPHVERIVATNVAADLDPSQRAAGMAVTPRPTGDVGEAASADFVVAFDVLDRCADVRGLVERAHRALRPGGLLFVITPSISGFDLQVMWERSRTVTPPDRINLLSLRGFRELFAAGWDIRELSTPGMFDAETVRRAMLSEPDGPWPRVLRQLLLDNGPEVLADLQEFLQRHRLSSFARLLLQKRS